MHNLINRQKVSSTAQLGTCLRTPAKRRGYCGVFIVAFLFVIASPFAKSTEDPSYSGLGSSVAVDGELTVAGGPEYHQNADTAGLVKVFNTRTGALVQTIYRTTRTDRGFGRAVAISGKRVVVGARSPRAYVFDLAGSRPDQPVVTFNRPETNESDGFGFSVAIDGSWVVVGTTGGSAYVYNLDHGDPSQPVVKLQAPSPRSGNDGFGQAVAISGAQVVIGSIGRHSACIFNLASQTPATPVYELPNPRSNFNTGFGDAVAISGNTVVVNGRGAGVHVFELRVDGPKLVVTLEKSEEEKQNGASFGPAVAVSGNRVAVADFYSKPGERRVVVFDVSETNPVVPSFTLEIPRTGSGPYDSSGSVAMSGGWLVVGSSYDGTAGSNAGNAYTFDLSGQDAASPIAALYGRSRGATKAAAKEVATRNSASTNPATPQSGDSGSSASQLGSPEPKDPASGGKFEFPAEIPLSDMKEGTWIIDPSLFLRSRWWALNDKLFAIEGWGAGGRTQYEAVAAFKSHEHTFLLPKVVSNYQPQAALENLIELDSTNEFEKKRQADLLRSFPAKDWSALPLIRIVPASHSAYDFKSGGYYFTISTWPSVYPRRPKGVPECGVQLKSGASVPVTVVSKNIVTKRKGIGGGPASTYWEGGPAGLFVKLDEASAEDWAKKYQNQAAFLVSWIKPTKFHCNSPRQSCDLMCNIESSALYFLDKSSTSGACVKVASWAEGDKGYEYRWGGGIFREKETHFLPINK